MNLRCRNTDDIYQDIGVTSFRLVHDIQTFYKKIKEVEYQVYESWKLGY